MIDIIIAPSPAKQSKPSAAVRSSSNVTARVHGQVCIGCVSPRFCARLQPSDVTRWFTLVGIVFSFLSTFFAHGFLSLARKAINEGRQVSRAFLYQNLVRNTNINLFGIGITLIGLQASGRWWCLQSAESRQPVVCWAIAQQLHECLLRYASADLLPR